MYWCPAYGHPDGLSSAPWFRVDGEWAYRTSGHPEGESEKPCIRIVEGLAYPTFGLPHDEAGPCFEVVGSFVYPVGLESAPWFCIKSRSHLLHPSIDVMGMDHLGE